MTAPRSRVKDVKAWGITDPGLDMPFLWRIGENRRLLVEDFVRDCQAAYRDPPYMPTWDDLKREGYRCIRVYITTQAPSHE